MADTIIWNGPEHVDYYAITFDDGPYRLPIERWLDALEAEGAAGTFFFTGEWLDRFPGSAKEILRRGHSLAPHSYYHRRMSQLPKDVFFEELKQTELAYQEATGQPCPSFMRFPYCNYNDERLAWLAELGYCDVEGKDSGDWAGISSEQIAQNLIPGLKNGYIAVLHSNDIAVGSPGAIKLLADAARHAGLVPVTVPALLESLGIKPAFRSWKLVVEAPERVDYPPEDWKPAEESDEVRRLAGQVSSWGIDRHVNGPSTPEAWYDQLAAPFRFGSGADVRSWFGVRGFSESYWGYARAYAEGDTMVIFDHAAKEAQADTLIYMLRWAAMEALNAGLTKIEARYDLRRMRKMCEQLGWKAELVPDESPAIAHRL